MEIEIEGGWLELTDCQLLIANDDDTDGQQDLYLTADGEYVLVKEARILDGRLLGPGEDASELAPELFGTGAFEPDVTAERVARYDLVQVGTPLTEQQALAWCIRTRIPEPLRELALRCVQG